MGKPSRGNEKRFAASLTPFRLEEVIDHDADSYNLASN